MSGFAKPITCPAFCWTSAIMPAINGDASLVPPIRYSPYFTTPPPNVWVWPTSMPVVGSPSAAMSGTTRAGAPLRFAIEPGTTFAWYDGCANRWLVPPPDPYRYAPGGVGANAPSLPSVDFAVSQPVSNRYWLLEPTPSDVPPTAVTHGLDAGQSGVAAAAFAGLPPVSSPLSPDEKYTPMPVTAACSMVSSCECMNPGGTASLENPYEFVTIVARCLSTTWLSEASRSW